MSPKRLDNWIDDEEYPDDKDMEQFGDDSPRDEAEMRDFRTMGDYGQARPNFWTPTRIALLVIVILVVAAILLPPVLSVLR